MQSDWRAIFGPALTTAVALIAFYVDRHFVTVPNPAPLFVCIVALASSLSGMASGLVSAVIAVISSALFFLNHLPNARVTCIDSFAGGFAVQSLLALWLFNRFGLSLSQAGFFFLWSGFLSAFSFPVASAAMRRAVKFSERTRCQSSGI